MLLVIAFVLFLAGIFIFVALFIRGLCAALEAASPPRTGPRLGRWPGGHGLELLAGGQAALMLATLVFPLRLSTSVSKETF